MIEKITLAAGCFWCYQGIFSELKGVISAEAGYANSSIDSPTYEQVCDGITDSAEAVEVTYDSENVNLAQILEVFWEVHDPTTLNKQGNDYGSQYRSGVYFYTPDQQQVALQSRDMAQENFSEAIVTEILPAKNFYPAEDYHQDFYEKNPNHGYCQVVIAPKIKKARAKFASLLNSSSE